jgi:hypothetical protein
MPAANSGRSELLQKLSPPERLGKVLELPRFTNKRAAPVCGIIGFAHVNQLAP